MKKIYLLLFLGMFLTNTSFSQMSFEGNKLKKSAFDLTEKKANFIDDNAIDSKIVIADEENDMLKKRRKKKGGRRGGGGDYSNSIKTNPLSMIFGTFGAQYERKIGDNMSVALTLGFYSRSTGILGMEYSYSGFSINPEFRYYFEEAIEGWYVSPYVTFTMINEKMAFTGYEEFNNKITVFGGGAVGGRQWIWGGFTLDLYAGVGYTSMSYTYDDKYDENMIFASGLSFSGVLPVFGAAIGYSF